MARRGRPGPPSTATSFLRDAWDRFVDLTTAIGDTLIERIAATVLDTIHEAASGSRSGLLVTALGPKHEKVLRHAFGARCGHGVFGTLNRRWPPAPG